jgi:hypothetical protein
MTQNSENAPSPFDLADAVYTQGRLWVMEQARTGEEFDLHRGAWEILSQAPREALEAMAFAALRHKMVQKCGAKSKVGDVVENDPDRKGHPLAATVAVWEEDAELGKKLVQKQPGLFIGWEAASADDRAISENRRRRLGTGSIREADNIRFAEEQAVRRELEA